MADDSQGFDWSALLQSATPFAAALIPAALGAAAGGKGGAATGAATGLAEGMRGQVVAQQEYERQRAQVQEANQRAEIAQQEQALRTQELRARMENYRRQDAMAEAQIPHLQAQTNEIRERTNRARLTDENQVAWAKENLKGAQLEAFLGMDKDDRSKRMDRWESETNQANALPSLVQQAKTFGMPEAVARSIATGPKGFDRLSKFVDDAIQERNKPREPSYVDLKDNYTDAQGNPMIGRFNRRTGLAEFFPVPAGVQLAGGGAGGKGAITPGTKEASDQLAKIRDDARQLVEGQFRTQGPMGAFIDFRKLDADPVKAREKFEDLVKSTEERMIKDAESRGIRLRGTSAPKPAVAEPNIRPVISALEKESPAAKYQGKTARDPETGLEFKSVKKGSTWVWEQKQK